MLSEFIQSDYVYKYARVNPKFDFIHRDFRKMSSFLKDRNQGRIRVKIETSEG